MGVTIALIKFLRSQGVPEATILGAVEAVEAVRTDDMRSAYEVKDAQAERRRAADRERARAKLRRKSAETPQSNVASDSAPSAETPQKICGNSAENPQNDDAHIYTTLPSLNSEKKERKKIYMHPIPPDWLPSSAGRLFATSKGWSDARVDAEAERFRNHALARDRKLKDWDAAWRNWVTSPFQGIVNGTAKASESKSVIAAARRFEESFARTDFASDSSVVLRLQKG